MEKKHLKLIAAFGEPKDVYKIKLLVPGQNQREKTQLRTCLERAAHFFGNVPSSMPAD